MTRLEYANPPIRVYHILRRAGISTIEELRAADIDTITNTITNETDKAAVKLFAASISHTA